MQQTAQIIQFDRGRMEHEEASAPDTGYIKLFRTLQDCSFAHRPEFVSAWVHILLMASHKPHKTMIGNKPVQLGVGQFVSGRKALAAIVGVTEKQMRGILDFFVGEGMLERASSRAGTVFTVCNYSEFQADRVQSKGQAKARRDAGSSDIGANKGPTQGQEGPTVLGQAKGQQKGQGEGQAKASNGGASSDIGANERAKGRANERANGNPDERATIQENNISTSNEVDIGNAPDGACLPATVKAPPKRKVSAATEFTTTLINKGVPEHLADEYAKVRKAKRLPLSAGALTLLEREAAKAQFSLKSAVETCVLRGWGGFKAEWLENDRRNCQRRGGQFIPDNNDTSWADGFDPYAPEVF